MKKVCLIIICLFSFLGISMASVKYNAKVYFENNGKTTKTVVAKAGSKAKLDICFKADKFSAYAILFELDYDKSKLEIESIEGKNNFEVTEGAKILADRIDIPDKDDHKVMTITFKVKTNDKTKVTIKDTEVADINEQFKLDDAKLTIASKSNDIYIYCAIGAAIIIVAGAVIVKRRKK